MMTCKELAELLMAFCDGELPKEHCERICQHISECPPCLYLMESYKLTVRICRELPATSPPAHLLDKLRAAAQEGGDQAVC
jgi:anti-sigma factor RsiW